MVWIVKRSEKIAGKQHKVHAASWGEIQNKPWINADFASICRKNSTYFESRMINHFPCNQLTIFFPTNFGFGSSVTFFYKTNFSFYYSQSSIHLLWLQPSIARPKGQKAELPWIVLIFLGQLSLIFLKIKYVFWTTNIFVLTINSRTLSYQGYSEREKEKEITLCFKFNIC